MSKIEITKNIGDHAASLTAGTAVVLSIAEIAQYVSMFAGTLAIMWYLIRAVDRFFLHPIKERRMREWYINELSKILKQPEEVFSQTPIEVLRDYYRDLSEIRSTPREDIKFSRGFDYDR